MSSVQEKQRVTIEVPYTIFEVGKVLEKIRSHGHPKPLRVALRMTKRAYSKTKDEKYLDAHNWFMLVKHLLICYNIYSNNKQRYARAEVRGLLKTIGVL